MRILIYIKNNRYEEVQSFYGSILSSELKINNFSFYSSFHLSTKLIFHSTRDNSPYKFLWIEYKYYN